MLYYDRFEISEGIDINKTSASKECIICYYWYFLNRGFNFQPYVCNKYDLFMMSMNLSVLLFQTLKVLIIAVSLTELVKVKL